MKELNELNRIKEIYDNYLSKEDLLNKWSNLNEGNSYIERETTSLIKSLLGIYTNSIVGKDILDVGCSGGGTIRFLKNLGACEEKIIGVDIREDRLKDTKEVYPKANFHYMDARNLNFEDNKFDLISVFTIFSSILKSEHRKRVSNEIIRVLKPGGIILYYDFRYNNPLNKNVLGIRRIDIDILFPNMFKNIHLITLLPPIARRLGSLTKSLYPILSRPKILRTHYAGLIIKADNY